MMKKMIALLCTLSAVPLLAIYCAEKGHEFNNPLDENGTNYLLGDTANEADKVKEENGASGLYRKYTVTFNANNGSGTAPDAQTVSVGSAITLPGGSGLTRSGCKFGGWNTNSNGTGTNYNDSTLYKPTANVILYTKWTPLDRYTVTFNSQGGSGVNSRDVVEGYFFEDERLPEPTRPNYKFEGWYAEPACINVIPYMEGLRVISDTTLYAKWAEAFTDSRDGRIYKKTTIGTQTWMAENLDYDVPNDTTDVCFRCFGQSIIKQEDNCKKYGRYYNWSTAMGIDASYNESLWGKSDVRRQGICPAGWHLPNDAEWTTLVEYAGGELTAGTKLKSKKGYNYWYDYNWGGGYDCANNDDDYGFSALGAGFMPNRNLGSILCNILHTGGNWWSATEYDAEYVWLRTMDCGSEGVGRSHFLNHDKRERYSVRCVKDE
jgi:uncharacterized protein (TIGR02145 family)/uncharacterized repeat protein (TIGR02543 family)